MLRKACLAVFVALALLPAAPAGGLRAATPRAAAPATTRPLAAKPFTASARAGVADVTAAARHVERLAEQLVARQEAPGLAMAVVQDGKIVSLRAFGVTGGPGRQPVTSDTVFRLASLSKGFAATLTAQLVSEGAMSWDSPIINQLPAFKLRDYASARNVTVRDVLSHRVGLTHNTYDRDLEAAQPYPLLAERLSNAPMACNPGECYAYQNVAFSLIGDLVFAATADFYSHQVEKRIFHPLGMYASTYGREALEASPSWARPHTGGRARWTARKPNDNYYPVPPAAGVNSSIHDMAQWVNAQLGHRPDVLAQPLLDQIHAPQVLTPGETRGSGWRRERLRNAWYGLGWRVMDYSGHTLIFHGGAVQGYRGLIAFLPNEDVGIVVLWNSESSAPSRLMPSLMDRVLGLPARDWSGLDDEAETKD
jgi:beta-lactamase class C